MLALLRPLTSGSLKKYFNVHPFKIENILNMNTVEVVIENTQQKIQVPQGSSLAELARTITPTANEPLGAFVNNKLTPLQYRIYNPKVVRFLDITYKLGYSIYTESLCFLLYKAVVDLYPQSTLHIEHAMVNGCFCRITDIPEGKDQIDLANEIREHMIELQSQQIPFESRTMLSSEAVALLQGPQLEATRRLIEGQGKLYTTVHFLGQTPHHISMPLVPHTGCLSCWDFRTFEDGFLLIYPDRNHPDKLAFTRNTPKLFSIFQEHRRRAELLQVPTIHDLNSIVLSHRENHLIQVAEALHEKKYAQIADLIAQRRDTVKMVLLAGPSSSGKTTSCRRLAVQLSVLGFDVQQISLDDYFLPRVKTPKQPNGDYDFEALEALDIPLLNDHLMRLFNGEQVEIPTYDFIKGEPFFSGKKLDMVSAPKGQQTILLVEGIHALNPKLTEQIPDELKFRVYVSALTQISIDNQNIIHSSDNRLIRRIVRDNNFRGYSALDTIRRWDSVQAGEIKHIYPFQENADVMFNSALLYELGLLKTYAQPLLEAVPENCAEYAEARRLLNFMELFEPISSHYIPPTSILREFLGDSSFEY